VKDKKLLPVFGQTPPEAEASEKAGACSGACCSDAVLEGLVETPETREANPEAPEGGLARTVVRVEGMDCASCAATVERQVGRVPGVRRAVVTFAAGRLDAEHDPGLGLPEIEKAVRNAGYGVAGTREVERPPFWRTPRAVSVFASSLLIALGLALWLVGAPEVASVGAYLAAIAPGGWPIFRAALAGLRTRNLDMNVLMSAATVGAAAIGEWAEAASVVV
jgi:Cd2+/Zn2+-exporting ATPase